MRPPTSPTTSVLAGNADAAARAPAPRRRCARARGRAARSWWPRDASRATRPAGTRRLRHPRRIPRRRARRPRRTSRNSTSTASAPRTRMRSRRTRVVGARARPPARIGEIAVAVGEAPGDPPLDPAATAGVPGSVTPVMSSGGAPVSAQTRRIPDGRHAEIEVHVVGDQRDTGLRVDARPPPSCCCPAPRVPPARAGGAGGGRKSQQRRKRLREHRRAVCAQAASHAARVGGVVRRIPVRVTGVDEGDEFVRGVAASPRARRPRARGGAVRARRAASRTAAATTSNAPPAPNPRAARRAAAARSSRYSQGRARRLARPALTPRVYASMTARSVCGRRFDHAPRHGAKTEAPRAHVLLQRHRAEQLRQLARRVAGATDPSGRSDPARARTRAHRPGRRARPR